MSNQSAWTAEQLTEMCGDDVIGKLAFQSGCHKRKLCNHPDGDGWIINDDTLEKFAELIVRECAEQASLFSINKNQIHQDITYDKMPESAKTVCHITSQQISETIKNHFGVKS